MKRRPACFGMLYLCTLLAMNAPAWLTLSRESVRISGPDGRPCLGTTWTPDQPRAVIVLGHGVTSNRGVMATLAKSYAANGYVAVAFDFWGHGRSRERFDWPRNPDQVLAWCDWARSRYPGLPLAYLGHSMGGFSGSEAFSRQPDAVDAFISLGALPREVPDCKTLVAAGVYEELFSIEQAITLAGDQADVISSPWSNHLIGTSDPVLIARMMEWTHAALGLPDIPRIPLYSHLLSLAATAAGIMGAFGLAAGVLLLFPRTSIAATPGVIRRHWSINPYRVAGLLLARKAGPIHPHSGTLRAAMIKGFAFALLLVVLLSGLLNTHKFTCHPWHFERLLTWGILALLFAPIAWIDTRLLEQISFPGSWSRFSVAALTRAIPLTAAGAWMWMQGPGIAFGGMMLWIIAFVLVMHAAAHAVVVWASGDYRSGAFAAGTLFAWVAAFWFPLYWPWT